MYMPMPRHRDTDTETQRLIDTRDTRHGDTHTHGDTQRHTHRDRLNAKRPACQSNQLTDASQNSLTVAELLRT